ncbi:MAG: AsmA family protein [Pseudoxanthomonas suwonensis]|nr:AsmA family protein [Pseudoxanthomonas suwonensis]
MDASEPANQPGPGPQRPASTPNDRAKAWLAAARRHPWRLAGALVLLGILLLLLLWDWNWFKGPIERRVTAQTGRSFQIDGNLGVDLGRRITVRADGLRLGNAPWARAPEMARSGPVELDLEAWPLLRGQVRIPRVDLERPVLNLERDADNLRNWVFRKGGDGTLPAFRDVRINEGLLTFFDPEQATDLTIAMNSQARRPGDAEPPVAIGGSGKWKGNPFKLRGIAESPLELRNRERPYRIDLKGSAGPTHATARGTLLDPVRMRDFDLDLAISGADMADLYPLIGVALPPTPEYRLHGRLTRDIDTPSRSTWKYDDVSGKVGQSDLAGFAHVSAGGQAVPHLRADLRSRHMRLDDLGGFIGYRPGEGAARLQSGSGRLLPDAAWNLEKLRAMDADVRLRAARIETRRLPVDSMDATLALAGGRLRLAPLDFGVARGSIRSTIELDAREDILRSRADIRATGLDLARLMPDSVQLGKTAVGRVRGHVRFSSTGNSVAKIAANANGEAEAGMGGGRVSKLLMQMAAVDLVRILRIKLTEDEQIPIRCAWGDFTVKDGVMTPSALVFDTTDVRLDGGGTIDLRNERLDLVIKPRPKRFSPLSLRTPLYLEGSFVNPELRPDYARMGLRAVAAAALGQAAAPAALVATTELGKGKDSQYCGG